MKNLSIILVSLVFITSCRTIVKWKMDVRQPRIESNQSITEFVAKAEVVSDEIYHIDSVSSYGFWKDPSRMGNLPDIEIYNSSGALLKQIGNHECSGLFSKTLADIDFTSLSPVIIEPKNLLKVLSVFERLDGKKAISNQFKPDEFIVCITFTNSLGKISITDLKEWTYYLKKNKEVEKIKILYLNVDMHESWGIHSRKDSRRLKFKY